MARAKKWPAWCESFREDIVLRLLDEGGELGQAAYRQLLADAFIWGNAEGGYEFWVNASFRLDATHKKARERLRLMLVQYEGYKAEKAQAAEAKKQRKKARKK